MTTKTQRGILAEIIISLVFGLIFGGVVIWLSRLGVEQIIDWAMIIAGVIIAVTNIAPLIRSIVNIREIGGIFDTVVSGLALILGIVMIFCRGTVISTIITVLLALYLIALPIVRIIIAPSKKEQLSKEWLRILIGALLIAFLPAALGLASDVLNIVLLVAGIVLIVLTLISFVLSLVAYIKGSKQE